MYPPFKLTVQKIFAQDFLKWKNMLLYVVQFEVLQIIAGRQSSNGYYEERAAIWLNLFSVDAITHAG